MGNIRYGWGVYVLVVIMSIMSGCGYTTQNPMKNGIQTISVPNFKNAIPQDKQYTYESGLEIDVTNAVVDRILYDGNLSIAKDDVADAILEGSITGYSQSPVRFTSIEGVKQYRMFLSVSMTLRDRRTGEIVFSESNFTGSTDYYIEGGQAISERAAADQAIQDIAKKIVDRITEDW